ncbi:MAG: tetratricopeptide repeat protein [Nitriliruptoraceae bacterium]|nr:tetratricopeptide repeat protein [Nitriliruptoraceae bacterium]
MHPSPSSTVFDVDAAAYDEAVLERSTEVPVVVDFWAAWCGPCRTLGPMIEAAVEARDGQVVLAKVDVDANPTLAQTYRVQGIPQVIGIRDRQVIASFTGAVPATTVERFLDDLLPTAADQAVARARALEGEAAIAELTTALELDPGHREAAIGLAALVVDDDPPRALELVRAHRPDPKAEAIATRAQLADHGGGDVEGLRTRAQDGDADGATLLELGRALAARGEYTEAIDRLLGAIELGGDTREPAREQLVALFGVLGDDDPRVAAARPRLARALF